MGEQRLWKRKRVVSLEDKVIPIYRCIQWLSVWGTAALLGLIPWMLIAEQAVSGSSANITSSTSTPAIEIKDLAFVFCITGQFLWWLAQCASLYSPVHNSSRRGN